MKTYRGVLITIGAICVLILSAIAVVKYWPANLSGGVAADLANSTSSAALENLSVTGSLTQASSSLPLSQKIVFSYKEGNNTFIYETDGQKRRALFTDKDEKEKVIAVSNLSVTKKVILALTSDSPSDQVGDISLISTDGLGKITPLISDFAYNKSPLPKLSQDGNQIAYVRSNENSILYTMDTAGSNKRQIAASVNPINSLAWSPDSHFITYTANDAAGENGEITLIGLKSASAPVVLYRTTKQPIDHLAWGNAVLYFTKTIEEKKQSVQSLSLDGKRKIQDVVAADSQKDKLSASPNGSYLAYRDIDPTQSSAASAQIKVFLPFANQTHKLEKAMEIIGWTP